MMRAWLPTVMLLNIGVSASFLSCKEAATPRIFGGNFKSSRFNSVAIAANGDIVAGGLTLDETIFAERVRPKEDIVQDATSVLAYYPVSDVTQFKLFQIYMWPNEMPIGRDGQVSALSVSKN